MEQKRYIFKKTHELDKDHFAELLLAAKGERRSMRAFALECGADPSTFTRIIQKSNKGASSIALIEALAKHADPDSGVTIQQLAHVNGYTVTESTRYHDPNIFMTNRQNNIRTTRMVIAEELLSRNKEFHLLPSGFVISRLPVKTPDLIISTDAFGEQNELWILNINNSVGVDLYSQVESLHKLETMSIVDLLGRYMLVDRSKNNERQAYRYSEVFFNRNAFFMAVETFGSLTLPITFSFILIDSEAGTIVDEFFVPHEEKGHQQSFFLPKRAQGL